jgi:small subunit ribosomal protein S6
MIEHQKTLITDGKGVVHRVEDWGRRHLAYSINRVFKAHYVLMNIECSQSVLEGLENWFKFNDAVLRKLIISVKGVMTGPTVMAEALKREEKGERRKRNEEESRTPLQVDYKDLDLLKHSVMENGRIIPARISGAKASIQRKIAHAIKLARYLSLLPYCDRHK